MRSKITNSSAITAVAFLVTLGSLVTSATANTLFGGVTHSEAVPAVNTRYPIAPLSAETPERGAGGEKAAAPPSHRTLQNPGLEWSQIPKWMAGTWVKQGDQTVRYTDLRTGVTVPMNEWTEDQMTVTWGNQVDSQGNIWQAHFIPWERDSRSNGKFLRFIIIALKPEGFSSDQLVSRSHFIVTEILGTQIVNSFQQESLNDYVLLPSGQIENHSSNRDFTDAGQPMRQGMLVSRFTKVAPFAPEVTHNGIDMLNSLNDYLRAHNMSQLVRHAP
jgi:hypothetical protein